jgi:hypothetical protein
VIHPHTPRGSFQVPCVGDDRGQYLWEPRASVASPPHSVGLWNLASTSLLGKESMVSLQPQVKGWSGTPCATKPCLARALDQESPPPPRGYPPL